MGEVLDFYTPDDLPPEIAVYESGLEQLSGGNEGKIGALALRLAYDKSTARTVVREQYSRIPLFAQRALYLEESLPSMAYLYIISPSGGVLQGDRYRMDITLEESAFAHITTQGATRIYRMEKNYATQIVNISIGEASYLEFIPDQIIPYRNSRFYQKITLRVHESATAIYSEIIVPGRVHSGESFEYDICYTKVVVKDQADVLKFIDVGLIEPKRHDVKSFGVLGEFKVLGTVYIINKKQDICSKLKQEINATLRHSTAVSCGSTLLPSNSGIVVRLLGHNSEDIKKAVYEVASIARKLILGAPFTKIRKN